MKKIAPLLFNELRKPSAHVVLGWLLERRDGYTLGFTSGDVPFTIDGVLYEPTNAFSGMAASSRSNLSVDNMSAVVLTSDRITEWDLQAGLYDNAYVRMFWVDPHHPEYGTLPLQGGRLGEVVIRQGTFEVELRSPLQMLQQPFGEFYTLECSADLGDSRCKVWLDAEEWQPGERYIAKAGADAGIGSYVKPRVQNGFWYQCVSAKEAQAEVVTHPEPITNNTGSVGWQKKTWTPGQDPMEYMMETFVEFFAFMKMKSDADWFPVTGLEKAMATRMGGKAGARVTVEGKDVFGGSFYQASETTSGVAISSVKYLTPTKEGKVPLSAPAGTQPLTITNTSTSVTYAVGQSGEDEPDWPTELDALVTDGDLTWKTIYARRIRSTVTAAFSRSHFSDNSRTEPYEHWRYGVLEWLTGGNRGLKVEVRAYSNIGGGGFALLEQMPAEIMPGDEYEVVRGCAKTRLACKGFDNIHNFRGFPDMPTEEKALATANITSKGTQKKQDSGGS